MSERTDKLKGNAAVAGGASLFAAPIGIRAAESRLRPAGKAKLKDAATFVRSQKKTAPKPTETAWGTSQGKGGKEHKVRTFVSPESAGQKVKRQKVNRRLEGAANTLGRAANKVGGKPLYANQTKLWAGTIAAGTGASLAAGRYREKVVKKLERSDKQVLGGVGAAGAYQGASMALKPFEQKGVTVRGKKVGGYEAKIKADENLQAKQKEHRAKHLPKGATAGHKGWLSYSRSYPKDLPGAGLRRTQAWTHSGKTGTAATLAVGAAGAMAAGKSHDKKIKKSAFGVEHDVS